MNDRLPRIMGLPDEERRLAESYSTVMTDKALSRLLDDVLGEGWRGYPCTCARSREPYHPRQPSRRDGREGRSRRRGSAPSGRGGCWDVRAARRQEPRRCMLGRRAQRCVRDQDELDTFARLEGQLLDYLDVFEAVYIVVPEARLGELPGYVPDGCGVLSYRQRPQGTYGFDLRRAASAFSPLDPAKQLAAMDKRGICSSFGMDGDGVPRSELERRCLRSFGAEEIGRGFKRYLLRRYGPVGRGSASCSPIYSRSTTSGSIAMACDRGRCISCGAHLLATFSTSATFPASCERGSTRGFRFFFWGM